MLGSPCRIRHTPPEGAVVKNHKIDVQRNELELATRDFREPISG